MMIRCAARKLTRALGIRTYADERHWLDDFAARARDVLFLQIGAHDGKTDDKLYRLIQRHGWRGVLLEPVPYLFERLVTNYAGNPRLKFENSALASSDGTTTFYRLRQTDDPMPHWYDQLGTMNRDVILRHGREIPDIENYLIEERVACISYETLLRKYDISKVDLILIDTEGSDLEVLRQIDFKRHRPQLLIYEHKHLSSSNAGAAVDLLASQDYRVFGCGDNNVAVPKASVTWQQQALSFVLHLVDPKRERR
jgi:FkbM family methyltransferase